MTLSRTPPPKELAIAWNGVVGAIHQLENGPSREDSRMAIAQLQSVKKCLRTLAPDTLGELPE